MKKEIDLERGVLDIDILGVNPYSHVQSNDQMCDGRDLPWLQEEFGTTSAWDAWVVTYRDVRILNEQNELVGVYNLTEHNLSLPDNYAALKAMLLEAAGGGGDQD